MKTQCRASPGVEMAVCWPQSARYVRYTRMDDIKDALIL